MMKSLLTFSLLFLLASCLVSSDSPISSSANDVNLIQRNDIIVSNAGNDSIILLDADGNYKSTLVDVDTTTTITFNGLAYDGVNREVLYAYDHQTAALDAIYGLSLFDGSSRLVLSNNQLAGTLPGLARLTNGELLILETNGTIEKFTAAGARVGAPFTSAMTTTVADISRRTNGGYVVCSSGTSNTVRTYTAAGVLQNTATSANPAPSLGGMAATSCSESPDGSIIVSYSGTNDAVRAYSSNLSTVLWTFTDTNVLSTPAKLAIRANGNVLITDTGYDHIVELDSNGAFVRTIGGSVLSDPNNIVVIP